MGSERLPSADQLLEAASFVIVLMNLGNEVLVHCKNGLDRAPMVACAALILQGPWPRRGCRWRLAGRMPLRETTSCPSCAPWKPASGRPSIRLA